MAPRKSTASTASAAPKSPSGMVGDDAGSTNVSGQSVEAKPSPAAQKANRPSTGGEGADGERADKSEKKKAKNEEMGIDDLLLPRTLTARLSRGTLPPNTSIQRDALLALTKSATVFISYIVHNANNLTPRKTIQAADVLEALKETELWNVNIGGGGHLTLGERVQAEYEKWEEDVVRKRKGYRDRVKARESTNTNHVTEDGEDVGDDGETEEGRGTRESRGPQTKRIRRDDDDSGSKSSVGVGRRGNGNGADHDAGDDDGDDDDELADTTAAAAQLRGDEVANADGDDTETDQWATAEDEDAEEEEVESDDDNNDEEEEDEDEEEEEEEDNDDDNDDNDIDDDAVSPRLKSRTIQEIIDSDVEENPAATTTRQGRRQRQRATALAPNGRVEIGSDDEESSD